MIPFLVVAFLFLLTFLGVIPWGFWFLIGIVGGFYSLFWPKNPNRR